MPNMDPINEIQPKLARTLASQVPPLATESLVAIVAGKTSVVRQVGSGLLLAVADHEFVVTAGHVVRRSASNGEALAISGSADGSFVATVGNWIVSSDSTALDGEDPSDIAVYPLRADQAARLQGTRAVRIGDVSFAEDLQHCYFVLVGFPNMWTTLSINDDQPVEVKPFLFGTDGYKGSTAGLHGFSGDHHFLLRATHDELFDQSGNATGFRTRGGYPAELPADLGGVSGGSVWAVGDVRTPPQSWSTKHARLVGVEIGVYKQARAIKATRWRAVITLLHLAFPDLRPALEMYVRT